MTIELKQCGVWDTEVKRRSVVILLISFPTVGREMDLANQFSEIVIERNMY